MSTNNEYANRGLGWKPDVPDVRDHIYSAPQSLLVKLPASVDLRLDHKDTDGSCGPDKDRPSNIPKYIFDQIDTNSCVGNSVCTNYTSIATKQGIAPTFIASRLFIYYNARKMIGEQNIDEGCVIRDAFKSINKEGVVSETDWQFSKSMVTKEPPTHLYEKAQNHQVIEYKRIPRTLEQLKGCIAEGYPFVFGFSVYGSFYSDETTKQGIANLPGPHEQFLGGHAVLTVGYNDAEQRFICINSWGEQWGNQGCFTMPYEYFLNPNLSDDFWSIRLVEDGAAKLAE